MKTEYYDDKGEQYSMVSTHGPMVPEIKAEFVKRLREFDGPVSKTYLKTEDGCYCAMGILADIAVEAGVIPTPELETAEEFLALDGVKRVFGYYNNAADAGRYLSYSKMLPAAAGKWANVGLLGGYVVHHEDGKLERFYLTDHSDQGMPFSEIADIVEAAF